MMLTDLAIACRKSGLEVIERPGWQTRGHGQMLPLRSIAVHHTAGPPIGEAPSLNYIETRALSQLVLGRSGKVYVSAAGCCWHAGVVRKPEYGNRYSIGIEAEATGTAPWPSVQYSAYVRLCAALCTHYNIPVSMVLGHKEIASPIGRKSDPNFDMPTFRNRIQELIDAKKPSPVPTPTPPSNDGYLRLGSKGEEVKRLQAFTNRVYPTYSKLVVDGDFGLATEAVVKEFQRRVGLTPDGIVGPATRAKLPF